MTSSWMRAGEMKRMCSDFVYLILHSYKLRATRVIIVILHRYDTQLHSSHSSHYRLQNHGSSNSVKFYRTQDASEGRQMYRHVLKTKTCLVQTRHITRLSRKHEREQRWLIGLLKLRFETSILLYNSFSYISQIEENP